jgi:hypothetical protein
MASAQPTKKVRGCFQCSRRRIVCDRTEPSCLKCTKKDIECSGLGRIRFAEGIARRGRFKDCKIPKAGGNNGCQELPTTTQFQVLRWSGKEKAKKRRKIDANEVVTTNDHSRPFLDVYPTQRGEEGSAPPSISSTKSDEADDDEIETINRGCDSLTAHHKQFFDIVLWIAPINPKLRMLFSYCESPCLYLLCNSLMT